MSSGLGEVSAFLLECREIDRPAKLAAYLISRYKMLFGTEPPAVMLSLLKAKIAYRLQYVGLKSAGKPLTANFLRNYEASQKLNLEGFTDDIKFFTQLEMKRETRKGEVDMAKVKKAVSKVAKPAPETTSTKKENRAALLAKAAKMNLKNRRAMNIPELLEVTKPGTSKTRIDEILKKAVARWRSGLSHK